MFKGSIVALITPFNDDLTVNYLKLDELIEMHIKEGTDAILVLGTTSESPTLSHDEKVEIVKRALRVVDGRVPVIAGSGSNNTNNALKLSKEFESLGVDGLLLVTPYYNRSNDAGYIKHFELIADSVDCPIILYNVPGRTGCNLPVHVVEHLSKHPNIKGIKEASGNISYVMEIARYVNDDFVLLSGNDDCVIPILSAGGAGVVSVVANIIPKDFSNMVNLYMNGETKKALDIQLKYLSLINNLFIETNPIPIKEAMNYIGYEVGKYRLPLYEMSEVSKDRLYKNLELLTLQKVIR